MTRPNSRSAEHADVVTLHFADRVLLLGAELPFESPGRASAFISLVMNQDSSTGILQDPKGRFQNSSGQDQSVRPPLPREEKAGRVKCGEPEAKLLVENWVGE